MAFHPFRTFQKHQKKWLAAVTILAMITFIFAGASMSGGDLFSWASQAVGARGKYETVVKLYGTRVNTNDVRLLRYQRTMANEFMMSAVNMSHSRVYADFQRSLDKFGPMKELLSGYMKQLTE